MLYDILCSLFGGGYADWEMLEKCEYDFEDIRTFTDVSNMSFNSILTGIFCVYIGHIQDIIKNKIEEKKEKLLYFQTKENCCGFDKTDEMESKYLINDIRKLEDLSPTDDIEFYTNYLDNGIYILDKETRNVYKELLSKEIEKENDKLGFTSLDLD